MAIFFGWIFICSFRSWKINEYGKELPLKSLWVLTQDEILPTLKQITGKQVKVCVACIHTCTLWTHKKHKTLCKLCSLNTQEWQETQTNKTHPEHWQDPAYGLLATGRIKRGNPLLREFWNRSHNFVLWILKPQSQLASIKCRSSYNCRVVLRSRGRRLGGKKPAFPSTAAADVPRPRSRSWSCCSGP